MTARALRALPLLVLLMLPPLASAAEGLVHLCDGVVRLNLTCCCDHGAEEKAEPAPADACTQAPTAGCCDELNAQPLPSRTATAASGQSWTPLPLAVAPPSVSVAPAPPETLPRAWMRLRGTHRSTAPPLYIQHCSYLR